MFNPFDPDSTEQYPGVFPMRYTAGFTFSELVGEPYLGLSLDGKYRKVPPPPYFSKLKKGQGTKRKKKALTKKLESIKRQFSRSFKPETSVTEYISRFTGEIPGDWTSPNLDALSEILKNYDLPDSPVESTFPSLEFSPPPDSESVAELTAPACDILPSASLQAYFLDKLTSDSSSSESASESEHISKPKAFEKFVRTQKSVLLKFAAKQADIRTKALGKAREISKETKGKLKTLKTTLHRPSDHTGKRPADNTEGEIPIPASKKGRFWTGRKPEAFFKAIKFNFNNEDRSSNSSNLDNQLGPNVAVEDASNSTHVQGPSVALEEDTFYSSGNSQVQYGLVEFASGDFAPMTFAAVVYGDSGFDLQPVTQNVAAPRSAFPGKSREPEPHATSAIDFSREEEDDDDENFDLSDFPIESIESPVLPLFKQKVSLPSHLEEKYTLSRNVSPTPATGDLAGEQHMPEAELPEPEQPGSVAILQPDPKPDGSPEKTALYGLIGDIDKLIVNTELPKKRLFILRGNAFDCSSLHDDNPAFESAAEKETEAIFEENLANDMFEYLDETEDLVEECRTALFDTLLWKITELLLVQIEEDTGFSEAAPALISRFAEEIDFYNFERKSANFSSAENHVELFGKVIPRLTAFDDLEKELNKVGDDSDTKIDVTQEAHLLVLVVDSYRQIFAHLIRNVVLPCGDRIRKLIREILFVRTLEGELVLDISKIKREISTIRTTFENSDEVYRNYFQGRIKRCVCLLGFAEVKFKKVQGVMSLLEGGFSLHITSLVESITKISLMRDRVLEKYDLFYMLNHNHESFGSQDVHQWTHMSEYKRMTTWHYGLDILEFQSLLTDNIKILADSKSSIATMIQLEHENIANVERALDLRQQIRIQQCNVPGFS